MNASRLISLGLLIIVIAYDPGSTISEDLYIVKAIVVSLQPGDFKGFGHFKSMRFDFSCAVLTRTKQSDKKNIIQYDVNNNVIFAGPQCKLEPYLPMNENFTLF